MRQEKRIGFVAFADGFQRIEILGNQHQLHDFRSCCASDGFLKLFDRTLKSFDNGLPLVGDALPLQRFTFRFGFGFFDDQNFLGFAARVGGDLFALRGVDIVHRRFDFGIGNDIGHQHIDDFIAKARHIGVQFLLNRRGDSGLAGENLVERHARNMAEDDLLDIGLDLLPQGWTACNRRHKLFRGERGSERKWGW